MSERDMVESDTDSDSDTFFARRPLQTQNLYVPILSRNQFSERSEVPVAIFWRISEPANYRSEEVIDELKALTPRDNHIIHEVPTGSQRYKIFVVTQKEDEKFLFVHLLGKIACLRIGSETRTQQLISFVEGALDLRLSSESPQPSDCAGAAVSIPGLLDLPNLSLVHATHVTPITWVFYYQSTSLVKHTISLIRPRACTLTDIKTQFLGELKTVVEVQPGTSPDEVWLVHDDAVLTEDLLQKMLGRSFAWPSLSDIDMTFKHDGCIPLRHETSRKRHTFQVHAYFQPADAIPIFLLLKKPLNELLKRDKMTIVIPRDVTHEQMRLQIATALEQKQGALRIALGRQLLEKVGDLHKLLGSAASRISVKLQSHTDLTFRIEDPPLGMISLPCHSTDTVRDMKSELSSMMNVPPYKIDLTHRGQTLPDENSVRSSQIQAGEVICVFVRQERLLLKLLLLGDQKSSVKVLIEDVEKATIGDLKRFSRTVMPTFSSLLESDIVAILRHNVPFDTETLSEAGVACESEPPLIVLKASKSLCFSAASAMQNGAFITFQGHCPGEFEGPCDGDGSGDNDPGDGDSPGDVLGDSPGDVLGDSPDDDVLGDSPDDDVLGDSPGDVLGDSPGDVLGDSPDDDVLGDSPGDVLGDSPDDDVLGDSPGEELLPGGFKFLYTTARGRVLFTANLLIEEKNWRELLSSRQWEQTQDTVPGIRLWTELCPHPQTAKSRYRHRAPATTVTPPPPPPPSLPPPLPLLPALPLPNQGLNEGAMHAGEAWGAEASGTTQGRSHGTKKPVPSEASGDSVSRSRRSSPENAEWQISPSSPGVSSPAWEPDPTHRRSACGQGSSARSGELTAAQGEGSESEDPPFGDEDDAISPPKGLSSNNVTPRATEGRDEPRHPRATVSDGHAPHSPHRPQTLAASWESEARQAEEDLPDCRLGPSRKQSLDETRRLSRRPSEEARNKQVYQRTLVEESMEESESEGVVEYKRVVSETVRVDAETQEDARRALRLHNSFSSPAVFTHQRSPQEDPLTLQHDEMWPDTFQYIDKRIILKVSQGLSTDGLHVILQLGVPKEKYDELAACSQNFSHCHLKCLIYWCKRFRSEANADVLKRALADYDRQDLVEIVDDILSGGTGYQTA